MNAHVNEYRYSSYKSNHHGQKNHVRKCGCQHTNVFDEQKANENKIVGTALKFALGAAAVGVSTAEGKNIGEKASNYFGGMLTSMKNLFVKRETNPKMELLTQPSITKTMESAKTPLTLGNTPDTAAAKTKAPLMLTLPAQTKVSTVPADATQGTKADGTKYYTTKDGEAFIMKNGSYVECSCEEIES